MTDAAARTPLAYFWGDDGYSVEAAEPLITSMRSMSFGLMLFSGFIA